MFKNMFEKALTLKAFFLNTVNNKLKIHQKWITSDNRLFLKSYGSPSWETLE